MNRQILERALRDAFPARALRELQDRVGAGTSARPKPLNERIRSNTTISAFKYRDGIMCAADRKTSGWGYTIMSQDSIKIWPVGHGSVVLGCGSVSSIQLVEKTLTEANRQFMEDYEFPLSVEGQNHYLSLLLRWWQFCYGELFSVGVILAGVDDQGPQIYELEEDGCYLVRPEFATSGSGGFRVEDQLDARWQPDLSFQEALLVAMHGMAHSGRRDSGSSEPLVATPTVATITLEGGVTFLSDRTVEKALGQVLLTKRWANKAFARALIKGGEGK